MTLFSARPLAVAVLLALAPGCGEDPGAPACATAGVRDDRRHRRQRHRLPDDLRPHAGNPDRRGEGAAARRSSTTTVTATSTSSCRTARPSTRPSTVPGAGSSRISATCAFGMSRSLPASLSTAGASASRSATTTATATTTCTSPASDATRCCATSATAPSPTSPPRPASTSVAGAPASRSAISTPTATSTSTSRATSLRSRRIRRRRPSVPRHSRLRRPRGLPPEADRLYENLGDGTFRDVTDVLRLLGRDAGVRARRGHPRLRRRRPAGRLSSATTRRRTFSS